MAKQKRKFGDRRDGRWVKDVPGLTTIMMNIMPNRTDAEVYLHDEIDVTEAMKFIAELNEKNDYKTTLFHCIIYAVDKMVRERPKMNRFIAGRRMYERDTISLSFVVKRQFKDNAEESLMVLVPKDNDTLEDISHKILGDLKEIRKTEDSNGGGLNDTIDTIARMPRLLLMAFIKVLRWLDFWGKVPKALTDGDTNYTSIMFSNLGSIKGPAVYHHLNNYGTNSIMVTIGTIHKEEKIMPDGSRQIRDIVEIGATLDERIADGFYFIRSLRLLKYLMAHPEDMMKPVSTPSGFDYNAK